MKKSMKLFAATALAGSIVLATVPAEIQVFAAETTTDTVAEQADVSGTVIVEYVVEGTGAVLDTVTYPAGTLTIGDRISVELKSFSGYRLTDAWISNPTSSILVTKYDKTLTVMYTADAATAPSTSDSTTTSTSSSTSTSTSTSDSTSTSTSNSSGTAVSETSGTTDTPTDSSTVASTTEETASVESTEEKVAVTTPSNTTPSTTAVSSAVKTNKVNELPKTGMTKTSPFISVLGGVLLLGTTLFMTIRKKHVSK